MVFSISCSISFYFMVCSCSTYRDQKKLRLSTSLCVSTRPCSWYFIDNIPCFRIDSDASSLVIGDEEVDW